ncbi:FAD-dependent oxidoreductase [Streptomyces nogalater]
MEWDVIVVGARCAGGPTAMLFARQGYRVLLLDRAASRTDTLSTLYIQQPGVSRLERWGLLDAVKATGCPPLGRTVYEIDDVRLACAGRTARCTPPTPPPPPAGRDPGRGRGGRRRRVPRPLRRQRTAGGGRPGGRRALYHPGGRSTVERARLVVGADGMRSTVAELAGARTTVEHPG